MRNRRCYLVFSSCSISFSPVKCIDISRFSCSTLFSKNGNSDFPNSNGDLNGNEEDSENKEKSDLNPNGTFHWGFATDISTPIMEPNPYFRKRDGIPRFCRWFAPYLRNGYYFLVEILADGVLDVEPFMDTLPYSPSDPLPVPIEDIEYSISSYLFEKKISYNQKESESDFQNEELVLFSEQNPSFVKTEGEETFFAFFPPWLQADDSFYLLKKVEDAPPIFMSRLPYRPGGEIPCKPEQIQYSIKFKKLK